MPALLQGNDYELIIAGSFAEADYVKTIQTAAEQAGAADRVHILTRISEADKAWYYQHCLAYLQPSLAEGFGLPVVEAMQLGKPVFLSRLTSMPEVGGAAAYYFDDFSPASMQQVLAAGLAQHSPERAAAAQAQARQFSWQQAAADYLAIYQELLGH